jgi:hypothetical protein
MDQVRRAVRTIQRMQEMQEELGMWEEKPEEATVVDSWKTTQT